MWMLGTLGRFLTGLEKLRTGAELASLAENVHFYGALNRNSKKKNTSVILTAFCGARDVWLEVTRCCIFVRAHCVKPCSMFVACVQYSKSPTSPSHQTTRTKENEQSIPPSTSSTQPAARSPRRQPRPPSPPAPPSRPGTGSAAPPRPPSTPPPSRTQYSPRCPP